MKQKAPANKNQKYLAILLAVIMFFSVFMIFFSGGSKVNDNSKNEASTPTSESNTSTIPFSQIPGKQVHHQFNSVADGLNISPDGVMGAEYIDLKKTAGTPLEQSFGNASTLEPLYGADVTKRYVAYYPDGDTFELHSVPEQKILNNSFIPVPYRGYELLQRGSGNNSFWNVVGSPVILGSSRQSVKNVIDVLEKNATPTTGFSYILNQTNPDDVIIQQIGMKTNITQNAPADQYYMDLKKLDDGSYAQTSLFLNLKPEVAKNITALQTSSSERGVTYNFTTSGNITKLVISSDFKSLLNETRLIK